MGLLKGRSSTPAAPNGAPPSNGAGATAVGGNMPWVGGPGGGFAAAPAAPAAPAGPPQVFQNSAFAAPPAPQPPAPPPAPPAPAADPNAPHPAALAVQGEWYRFSNGFVGMFLSLKNGVPCFVAVVDGQTMGNPVEVNPAEPVLFVSKPAPVAPPPAPPAAPQPSAAAPTLAGPPSFAPQAALAPAGTPSFAPQAAPAAPQAGAAAPKRARRSKAEMEAARAAEAGTQAAPATSLTLLINVVPNGPFTDLLGYVNELTGEMEEQFGVSDVRAAVDDKSAIAFGRWKGVLASMVKESPPPPGVYVAFTHGNELVEVVVEALAPLMPAGSLFRGVR